MFDPYPSVVPMWLDTEVEPWTDDERERMARAPTVRAVAVFPLTDWPDTLVVGDVPHVPEDHAERLEAIEDHLARWVVGTALVLAGACAAFVASVGWPA